MLGSGLSLINSISVAAPAVNTSLYTGCNLVSLESATYDEFDPASGPDPSLYPIHSSTLLNWLYSEGVRSVRITFAWECIQSSLGGTIPCTDTSNYIAYWNALTSDITRLLALGIKVMIEPWQWNANIGSTDICYQGAAFDTTSFASLWSQLSSAINTLTSNDKRVSFGLINEPHPGAIVAGDNYSEFVPYAQAAINAIRGTGATNRIYVPTYNYCDPGTFTTNGSSTGFLTLTDSANNLAVSLHNYAGQVSGGSSATTALSDAISATVSWSQSNGNVIIGISEIAIDDGNPNGSLSVAQNQWSSWQTYCVAHKNIIAHWHWWAVSEAAWWGTGDSTNGSNWALNSGSDTTPSTYMTLILSSLGSY